MLEGTCRVPQALPHSPSTLHATQRQRLTIDQPSPPPNPNSLLNVLIAIVSDSYASAMAQVDELFWMARLAVVTEVNTIFR